MDLAWNNLKMSIKADIKLRIPQPQEQLYFFSDAKSLLYPGRANFPANIKADQLFNNQV